MPLLSGMIRSAAITGRTDTLGAWCAGRQGGRWAQQTVRAAMPTTRPGTEPAEAVGELARLRESGVITDAEFDELRARLGA